LEEQALIAGTIQDRQAW